MILSVRTFTIQEGKQQEAIAALVKIANYVNENHGGDVHVERNISGPMNQMHLIAERESLAAYESAMKKIKADEKLQKMVAEALGLTVGDHDLLLVEQIS